MQQAPFTRRKRHDVPLPPAPDASEIERLRHALQQAERCLTRTAQDERDLEALRIIRAELHH